MLTTTIEFIVSLECPDTSGDGNSHVDNLQGNHPISTIEKLDVDETIGEIRPKRTILMMLMIMIL